MNQTFKSYLLTMRIWQWAKNLVVFTLPIGSGLINIDTLYEVTILLLVYLYYPLQFIFLMILETYQLIQCTHQKKIDQ